MSKAPHELSQEFSSQTKRIHDLKISDAHFSSLAEDQALVNRQVRRAETRLDIVTKSEENALRHTRLHLKDQIAKALAAG